MVKKRSRDVVVLVTHLKKKKKMEGAEGVRNVDEFLGFTDEGLFMFMFYGQRNDKTDDKIAPGALFFNRPKGKSTNAAVPDGFVGVVEKVERKVDRDAVDAANEVTYHAFELYVREEVVNTPDEEIARTIDGLDGKGKCGKITKDIVNTLHVPLGAITGKGKGSRFQGIQVIKKLKVPEKIYDQLWPQAAK